MVNNAVLRGRIIDRGNMGEIIYLPRPKELTPEQKVHWETELEAAERRVEDCMRILGYLAIESGLKE